VSDKSYQSLEKTFTDLQGNNDIPFVDEGDDEDTMIRRVSVSDVKNRQDGAAQVKTDKHKFHNRSTSWLYMKMN